MRVSRLGSIYCVLSGFQTLLELAARSHWPGLLQSLLPALNLSRLAGSGALSAGALPVVYPTTPARSHTFRCELSPICTRHTHAVSMAGYKALMSMALNGRHELLRWAPPRNQPQCFTALRCYRLFRCYAQLFVAVCCSKLGLLQLSTRCCY